MIPCCVTSGQESIENNRESIISDKCNREGVTGTDGYRHTASAQRVTSGTLMRIVQLSEDGRVSAVLPERSDDLDPPALGGRLSGLPGTIGRSGFSQGLARVFVYLDDIYSLPVRIGVNIFGT